MIYFWHITDIHIDHKYEINSEPLCTKPICCRENHTIQISHAGKYGTPYGHCDIPKRTFEKVIDFIDSYRLIEKEKVKGVLFTGDIPATDIAYQTKDDNLKHMKYVYEKMNEKFTKGNGWKVFPIIGNHDTYPLNQLDYRPGGSWLLDFIKESWNVWFVDEEEQLQTIKEYGMYSIEVFDGIQVIGLNHFWVDTKNKFMKNYPDKKHLLTDWLREQMEKVKREKKKAIILTHIAPGASGYLLEEEKKGNSEFFRLFDEFNNDMANITYEYSENILLILSGHEHYERFIVIKDPTLHTIPTASVFLTPAITTFELSNPTVRLFQYDVEKKLFVDMLTYINIIEKSNKGVFEDNWKLEYSLKEMFGIDDLSPGNMQKVINMLEEDNKLMKQFNMFHFSSYVDNVCEEICKKFTFCSMNYITKEKYLKCIE